jgi:hypothetical protein
MPGYLDHQDDLVIQMAFFILAGQKKAPYRPMWNTSCLALCFNNARGDRKSKKYADKSEEK